MSSDIKIRPLEPEDIDFVYESENNQRNWRVSNNLLPYSRYDIEQFVLNNEHDFLKQGQIRFIIEEAHSGKNAGIIDLFMEDSHNMRAGVGVMVVDEFRNKGYARQSLMLIKRFAFDIQGLHQLYCHIHTDNEKSIRLFESSGFKRAGLKKDWFYFGGLYSDVYFYQLINPNHQ